MVDVGSHHFVKASEKSDTVLVPQPSDDPHDPLVCYRSHDSLLLEDTPIFQKALA